MLVVDEMHVVELGVWKAVFIQLLRILEALDKGSINKLDERWVSCPLRHLLLTFFAYIVAFAVCQPSVKTLFVVSSTTLAT